MWTSRDEDDTSSRKWQRFMEVTADTWVFLTPKQEELSFDTLTQAAPAETRIRVTVWKCKDHWITMLFENEETLVRWRPPGCWVWTTLLASESHLRTITQEIVTPKTSKAFFILPISSKRDTHRSSKGVLVLLEEYDLHHSSKAYLKFCPHGERLLEQHALHP